MAFFCRPRRDLKTVIAFHRDRTPWGIAVRFGGSEKVFPDFDPYGGLSFCDHAFGLLASPTFP